MTNVRYEVAAQRFPIDRAKRRLLFWPGDGRLGYPTKAEPNLILRLVRPLSPDGLASLKLSGLFYITQINIVRIMAHMTVSIEYGVHCLLWLVGAGNQPRSGRDLAEFQGISHSLVTKIFGKLAKAGIVRTVGGLSSGYLLARAPHQINLLQVTDAIDERKPLFACQEIRERCAAFGTQRRNGRQAASAPSMP